MRTWIITGLNQRRFSEVHRERNTRSIQSISLRSRGISVVNNGSFRELLGEPDWLACVSAQVKWGSARFANKVRLVEFQNSILKWIERKNWFSCTIRPWNPVFCINNRASILFPELFLRWKVHWWVHRSVHYSFEIIDLPWYAKVWSRSILRTVPGIGNPKHCFRSLIRNIYYLSWARTFESPSFFR